MGLPVAGLQELCNQYSSAQRERLAIIALDRKHRLRSSSEDTMNSLMKAAPNLPFAPKNQATYGLRSVSFIANVAFASFVRYNNE